MSDAIPGMRSGPRQPRRKEDFDEMYRVKPPWDIDRPQRAFVALADAGNLQGKVLDVGCGTGEHALMAAERGFPTVGVDLVGPAIATARRKATDRAIDVRFEVWDALRLPDFGETFDTVLDCGLFHIFDDDDRARFLESLRAVVPPGGRYFMLCFSDREPGDWGPRRITEAELRKEFADGWRIDSLEPAVIEILLESGEAQAWLISLTRS